MGSHEIIEITERTQSAPASAAPPRRKPGSSAIQQSDRERQVLRVSDAHTPGSLTSEEGVSESGHAVSCPRFGCRVDMPIVDGNRGVTFQENRVSSRETELKRPRGLSLRTTSFAIKRKVKGIWWMPWRQEAMKDVARCDKPGGEASAL